MSYALTEQSLLSEFEARPTAMVMFDPANVDFSKMPSKDLEDNGFIGEVTPAGLKEQYIGLVAALRAQNIKILELSELSDIDNLATSSAQYNLMFTRDPATTIPWAPEIFIPSNMSLAVRRPEVNAMMSALMSLSLEPALELEDKHQQYAEGGDLYPILIDNERTLLSGFGNRTSPATAKAIAHQLMPEVFDQVLMLEHDRGILHLDTGFTPLPNKTLFVAEGMFKGGMLYTRGNPSGTEIVEPLEFFQTRGYKVVQISKQEAVKNETVNMVPVGNNTFVGFPLPKDVKRKLEDLSGANFIEVPGDKIAPAQGGAHCLTRPVYSPIPSRF